MSAASPPVPRPPIVFYDGVCGLCNHWIDFLLRQDRDQRLQYAPLQGTTAAQTLPGGAQQQPESVILWDGHTLHERSDAVWRMLCLLPFPWPCCGWALRMVPGFLRNLGYKLVARNRYRWFGRKETCRMPTPAERALFLP
ncbi:MAG TPA: thiol-disulfide oxidoreductase [Planctomycetaceae bacterium]|nr:thiol-disulfide oxidoreductase [Planctomycetaceae bacterium]